MLNRNLFNVHDIVLITAIAVIAHFTLLPLYDKISKRTEANG